LDVFFGGKYTIHALIINDLGVFSRGLLPNF